MKTLRSISFLLLSALECFGQCNSHPFRPSLLPPCPSIADRLGQAAEAGREFNKKVDELNQAIDAARKRFWKAFPNGPDFNAAEAAFLGALGEKDLYYLMFALQEGMSGRVTRMPNVIGLLNGSVSPNDLDKFPKNVDNGISAYAFPLFTQWVNALRRAEGRERDGAMASPLILAEAIQDKSNQRKAYEHARNWAEFMSGGIDISKHMTPQVYMLHQMESDVSWVLEQAKTGEMPDGAVATRDLYNFFIKAFGEKEVAAAAEATLRAPKNSVGGLATRAPVEIGTTIGSPSPNPYLLFLTKLTNSSPRAFTIAVAIDQYALLGGQAVPAWNTKEQWEKAFSVYNQLNAKFGEATVRAAATRVMVAPKDPDRGLRGDQQAKGVLYWFTTLLKDPKAEIPDGQLAHFKAGSYNSRWNGRMVEVRGTVSRVDVDSGGFPKYATIRFKESPAADGITGYSPYSDMLQQAYGQNFAGLVGKVVDISGEVGQWREGAGVRILNMGQIKVLPASAGEFTESHPDWLTAPLPPSNLVDSPKYLAWKKYPAGTKVEYELRNLSEYRPGTDQYTRNKISRMIFTLESIDDKRAVVATESMIWRYNNPNAPPTRSEGAKLIYRAKVNRDVADNERLPATTRGEEILTINGKSIATHWEQVAGRDPMTFTKTWYSDDVPGGLVIEHKHEHRAMLGKTVTETIYAPDSGSPEVAKENSIGEAPAGYVAQPPPSNRPAAPQAAAPPAAAPSSPIRPPSAPAQPAVPNNRQRVEPPVRTVPPALSPQAEFARQYSSVMGRVGQAKSGLAQYQYRTRAELPNDIRAARDRLDTQLRAVTTALGAGDNALATQNLRAVEETVAVIQQFLANAR